MVCGMSCYWFFVLFSTVEDEDEEKDGDFRRYGFFAESGAGLGTGLRRNCGLCGVSSAAGSGVSLTSKRGSLGVGTTLLRLTGPANVFGCLRAATVAEGFSSFFGGGECTGSKSSF